MRQPLLAPAGTPHETITRYNTAINEIVREPQARNWLDLPTAFLSGAGATAGKISIPRATSTAGTMARASTAAALSLPMKSFGVGLPALSFSNWVGLFAPKGISPKVGMSGATVKRVSLVTA
jgi:tripartite-type tricarboxylate transporter receptor subunit TctC